MWKDLKIVHGRARHPQSQGSVERCNQDVKLLIVPDIDRGLTDARNVLAATMKIKHDKYKLGTEQGVLHDYYSFHQLSKAPRTPTL
ncbi:unnamed protein product [Rotaria sp. Silwood2]|nr:unnamed protein product [Rotaria sp. Silwood2]